MKKILVPTDFSDNAMKAATYAAEIATKTGATITLLHIYNTGNEKTYQPFPLHEKYDTLVLQDRTTEIENFLKPLAITYPGVNINTELLNAQPAKGILEYSHKHETDLIIMGTKGASGLREIFMGSITSTVIGKTKIPVLAIPSDYELEEPDALLFATNHFEKNIKLLQPVIDIAGIFLATVHVVVFVDKDTAHADSYMYNASHLEEYMNFLTKTFPGTTFTKELLDGHRLEDTFESYCEKNEVDMICVITYPKSMGEKILRKSVTKKMAFHSHIPLLSIPLSE